MSAMMHAMVLEAAGAPLRLRQVPVPSPRPDEVLVRVHAVGVGLTINIMMGTPGLVTSFPRIPGHEIAGEVVELGSQVNGVAAGQRVTCHFYLTCGRCRHCRGGRETLCPNFEGFIGMARDGGYAQYVSLPARNLVVIPDGVSFVDAAVAADAVATAYHACTQEARVMPGDDVLVVGAAGGVGIQAMKVAQAMGARVLAADVGPAKLAFLREQGADVVIDVNQGPLEDQVRAATGGAGVDAALDIVASKQTMESSFASLGLGGRLVMVGFRPKGMFGVDWNFTIDGWALNRGEREIHGSRYVNLAEIGQTLALIAKGRLKPVIGRTFALQDINAAHEALARGETLGRLAATMEFT
jgi:D-arabinose 1-dehydrogenase-like Zn-dependent alcohol dehydrogenase